MKRKNYVSKNEIIDIAKNVNLKTRHIIPQGNFYRKISFHYSKARPKHLIEGFA